MTVNFKMQPVDGDDHERSVCQKCDFINYDNPKVIVGVVVTYGDQYLLCKRANAPRIGKWTIPIGFMENGETSSQGAARETLEEANCIVDMHGLLCIFSVKRISQVHMIYSGTLRSSFSPGVESLEVALFNYEDIPWDELSFPNIKEALEHHQRELSASKPFILEKDLE